MAYITMFTSRILIVYGRVHTVLFALGGELDYDEIRSVYASHLTVNGRLCT